jgi:hypothetical protein
MITRNSWKTTKRERKRERERERERVGENALRPERERSAQQPMATPVEGNKRALRLHLECGKDLNSWDGSRSKKSGREREREDK